MSLLKQTFHGVSWLMLLAFSTPLFAAEASTGPAVKGFGPVFAVPEGSFNLDPSQSYKVIMDIGKGPDDHTSINRGIESAARFMNMSERNGLPPEKLDIAIVLHGGAAQAALNDSSYQAHFNARNANAALIQALHEAGAEIYLCGQSAAYRGYEESGLLSGVQMAVSAMTVHVRLQQEGYRAILF